ncbi:MAG: helix-turn-helix transcriptional regulator [Thermoplasmatota archaeon]
MVKPAGNALRTLHLLREGPQTAQALAAQLGLDVSSIRRHLDSLIDREFLRFDDVVDGPGRPKRYYKLTDAGWESFPRDYAFLLGALLDKLQARIGRDAILATFSEIAVELAADIPRDQPVAARLEALKQLYMDLGFEARLEEKQDGRLELIQQNCPFLKTAKADPAGLCECLDEGIIRCAMPDAEVELGDCMATGDRRCSHLITPRS